MYWILILVFVHGYGPREDVEFQRFYSKDACEKAAAYIAPKLERGRALCLFDTP